MTLSKKCLIYHLCITSCLLLACIAFGAGDLSGDPLFPAGLIMEEEFHPGMGRSIGNVLLVQGQAVIIHSDQLKGYWAKKDLPLYKGDMVVTRDKGRIRFSLMDGSTLTLSSSTKIVLSESIYDEKKKSRSSFLKLGLGKARFLVTKLIGFKESTFKVKTPTAILGVRGSDFVVEATETMTKVTTLGETVLEVLNIQIPEAPITLGDFQKTIVELDIPPTEAEHVTAEEAEEVTIDFIVTPEVGEPEGYSPPETGGESEASPAEEPVGPAPEVSVEEPAGPAAEVSVEEPPILVPEAMLVRPEEIITPVEREIIEPEVEDYYTPETTVEEEFIEKQDVIGESKTEKKAEEVVEELPGLPGTPIP